MMKESKKEEVLYKNAKSRVDRVKKFYRHLTAYVVFNIVLFGVKVSLYDQLGGQWVGDQGFQDWFRLNIYFTPLAWGFGLLVHGLLVFKYPNASLRDFKPMFIKRWEEKQIQKFIDKENELE